jgi:hypothetical protein
VLHLKEETWEFVEVSKLGLLWLFFILFVLSISTKIMLVRTCFNIS